MVWDATAYAVTTKAIGTVESNMNYGAVSVADPITLGAFQWYGTRAAGLLFAIKDNAPVIHDTFCPDSIKNSMSSHPASDSWWNGRIITKEEHRQLFTLLYQPESVNIQKNRIANDIDAYLVTAGQWGLSKDNETLATEFFCTIYHQSPNAASQIARNLPAKCTLDIIYRAALNNSIVGDYRTRQTTAYNIIKNQDTSNIDTGTGSLPDDEDGGDSDNDNRGGRKRRSKNHYIVDRGHARILHKRDGTTQTFYKSGGVWLAADDPNIGSHYNSDGGDGTGGGVKTEDPPTPVDPGGPATGAAAKIIAFARSKLGDFSYSQGPGRMTPETSGYTDCSAFLVYAFQKGANVALGGTYTGNLCTRGRLVKEGRPTEAEMEPGDLIFLRWSPAVRSNSPFDHVELYCGGGRRISMGRTPGPTEADWDVDINYALGRGGRVQIRRYL